MKGFSLLFALIMAINMGACNGNSTTTTDDLPMKLDGKSFSVPPDTITVYYSKASIAKAGIDPSTLEIGEDVRLLIQKVGFKNEIFDVYAGVYFDTGKSLVFVFSSILQHATCRLQVRNKDQEWITIPTDKEAKS